MSATVSQPPVLTAQHRAILHPDSVALIGVSDNPDKTSGRPLAYLRRAGFNGVIYPVNPRRTTVQGEPAWASVRDLPQVPDHAYILTPTAAVVDTVRECAEIGVKVVTILAAGFSESGPEGLAREAELRAIATSSGTRIIGPSSLGIVNTHTGLLLTANGAFAEPDIPTGSVFVASHSGSMLGALLSRAKARGTGFAGYASVGNEVDLSLGEICLSTLDDPQITGYLLFLESLQHGEALQRFAYEAARRNKPVFAYKLGRSDAGAELSATHTGALAGEDDVAEAFFRDTGIARVEQLETLFEIFPLAQALPLKQSSRPGRISVVTTTGGGAAMVVDQLGIRGITVEPASSDTIARLEAANTPGTAGRVIDLTLAGTNYDVMKSTLDILLQAPESDIVVAVVGSSARFQPELAVRPILDSLGHAKPLVAMLVPDAPDTLASLTKAGAPVFRTPESCADAISALLRRRMPKPLSPVNRTQDTATRTTLSEADGYRIVAKLGIAHAPFALSAMGEAPPSLPFEFPVVAKACSADLPHKSDVGGVILNIQSNAELEHACKTIADNLKRLAPDLACPHILFQPQSKGIGEVLVGYRVDPQAGPLIMLAAGGIWSEIMRDRSIRLAPVTRAEAEDMISEVRALQSLAGLRGAVKGDLAALADTLVQFSQLAVRSDLPVLEAEINPLMIFPQGEGVRAVDALVVMRDAPDAN